MDDMSVGVGRRSAHAYLSNITSAVATVAELQHEYATGRISVEELERRLPAALEAEEARGPGVERGLMIGPGVLIEVDGDSSYPASGDPYSPAAYGLPPAPPRGGRV